MPPSQWSTWTSPLAVKRSSASGKRKRLDAASDSAKRQKKQQRKQRNDDGCSQRRTQGGQLFLDFGQRDFERTTCAKCGMLYAPGVAADEADHARFCAASARRLELSDAVTVDPSWVVSSDDDDDGTTAAVTAATPRLRVLKLPRDRKKQSGLVGFVRRAKAAVVDPSMGFCSEEEEGKAEEGAHEFVCLEGKRLVGFLAVERLRAEHAIVRCSDSPDASAEGSAQGEGEADRMILGVRQIWVSSAHRRQGVARRLLDASRSHCFYAFNVPKASVAFTQPTELGRALAASYLGTSTVPVYKL